MALILSITKNEPNVIAVALSDDFADLSTAKLKGYVDSLIESFEYVVEGEYDVHFDDGTIVIKPLLASEAFSPEMIEKIETEVTSLNNILV